MPKRLNQKPARHTKSGQQTLNLESQLEPLSLSPPSFLQGGEIYVWNAEIVPLIRIGVIKETDYSSAVAYCRLASENVLDLPAAHLSHLSKLRDSLGLTPAARIKIAPEASGKKEATIAEVLELHAL